MKTIYQKAAVALALSCALPAVAHDIALLPEPEGNLTVRYGHPGDWLPTDKERLLAVSILQAGAKPQLLVSPLIKNQLALTTLGKAVTNGEAAIVATRYDNGLWVSTVGVDGKEAFHNTSKAMLPEGKNSLLSLKFAKGLFGKTDDATVYQLPVGHLLEVIPLQNPILKKPNETLEVLVRFKGKPLADAEVEITDDSVLTTVGQAKYKTDAQGVAKIPIKLAGLNVVSVDYKHPNNGSLGKAFQAIPVSNVMMVATYAFRN